MIRIEESVDVGAAAEDAFAFVTRVRDYPTWLPGVRLAEPLDPEASDDGTPRVGSRFRLVSEGPGGIRINAEGRVAELDPPRSITVAATSGYFALTATCEVTPLGSARSHIAVRAEVEPRGLAALAAGRIEQELRAGVPDALRRLREAVESVSAG